MSEDQSFIPGRTPTRPVPLARYLPPILENVVPQWLASKGIQSGPDNWLLDPFGTSPQLPIEAALTGFRVIVAANNPITRFLFEIITQRPSRDELQAALAELAASRKGDERLEPHIRSLYHTRCRECNQEIEAEAFVWEYALEGKPPVLVSSIYSCPFCKNNGEFPATSTDIERASHYSSTGLHYARALERVAAPNDPDHVHAEEALGVYLPRAVYALFSLINKLDGLDISVHKRQLIQALLLSACDQSNNLWQYPTTRARPRSLNAHSRFRENNVWMALEQAIDEWADTIASERTSVDLVRWPQKPSPEGGICLYEGRLRELVQQLGQLPVSAVITALPRPNQAFWTLSALWAGWLWGRSAVGPFKSVLRRRRYDWAWHTTALYTAMSGLITHLKSDTPFLGLIGEAEPGFLAAATIAGALSGFALKGLAQPIESNQAQITWGSTQVATAPQTVNAAEAGAPLHTINLIRKAARNYLLERNEPCTFSQIHAAIISTLARNTPFQVFTTEINTWQVAETDPVEPTPAEILSKFNHALEEALTYRGGFCRYGASEKNIEIGAWWLRDEDIPKEGQKHSLTDQVEIEIVLQLVGKSEIKIQPLEKFIYERFPGLLTPSIELINAILESYGLNVGDDNHLWRLRPQDSPSVRRAELAEIEKLLQQIAPQLGYHAEGHSPLLWLDIQGKITYVFYISASSIFGDFIFSGTYPPEKSIIVLPGGRANLAAYKLHHDARYKLAIEAGWRFMKFRVVREMANMIGVTPELFYQQIALDPLTYNAPQIRLL